MAVSRNLVSGNTTMLLLQMLSQKDMYGYEMIETLSERSNNVFELNPGHFGSKAFHMVLFLVQQGFGNENGHCHILMAGLFDHAVKDLLNVFPDWGTTMSIY